MKLLKKKKMLHHFILYTLNFLILKNVLIWKNINQDKQILMLIVTKIYCNLLSMVGLIKLFLRSKLNPLLKYNVDMIVQYMEFSVDSLHKKKLDLKQLWKNVNI